MNDGEFLALALEALEWGAKVIREVPHRAEDVARCQQDVANTIRLAGRREEARRMNMLMRDVDFNGLDLDELDRRED